MADKFGIRREGLAIMRNSDGKFIIQDGGQVLLQQGGSEYALQTQGGTDRVLIQPNCCCPTDANGDPICGECVDPLPVSVTVDFGAWGMVGASPGNYSDTCDTPCSTLNGEFVLDEFTVGGVMACSFRYWDTSFCTGASVQELTGGGSFYSQATFDFIIWAQIGYASTAWKWSILCAMRSDLGGFFFSQVLYQVATTTACITKTYTASRQWVQTIGNSPPCKNSGSGTFDWPTTIDLIVP